VVKSPPPAPPPPLVPLPLPLSLPTQPQPPPTAAVVAAPVPTPHAPLQHCPVSNTNSTNSNSRTSSPAVATPAQPAPNTYAPLPLAAYPNSHPHPAYPPLYAPYSSTLQHSPYLPPAAVSPLPSPRNDTVIDVFVCGIGIQSWNKRRLENKKSFSLRFWVFTVSYVHRKRSFWCHIGCSTGGDALCAPRILFRMLELLYFKLTVCVCYSLTAHFWFCGGFFYVMHMICNVFIVPQSLVFFTIIMISEVRQGLPWLNINPLFSRCPGSCSFLDMPKTLSYIQVAILKKCV